MKQCHKVGLCLHKAIHNIYIYNTLCCFHVALERASAICRQADIVGAMSMEVLKGTSKAYREG